MKFSSSVRKWSRNIHRDLSFLFSGMLIVYAISGVAMNHVKTFNPNYSITVEEYSLNAPLPSVEEITKEYVINTLLTPLGEEDNYTKHYYPQPSTMKVFIKGGSSLVIDLNTNTAVYESIKQRYVLSAMTKLHYNPGGWWTVFSDVFVAALIIIILTGLIMIKGKKGLIGIGGIELIIGMAIPLLFILL